MATTATVTAATTTSAKDTITSYGGSTEDVTITAAAPATKFHIESTALVMCYHAYISFF